jgi:hypothetical protein
LNNPEKDNRNFGFWKLKNLKFKIQSLLLEPKTKNEKPKTELKNAAED